MLHGQKTNELIKNLDPRYVEFISETYYFLCSFQTPAGSWAASPDFSNYSASCWLRDGGFITDTVSKIGGVELGNKYFNWVSKAIIGGLESRGQIFSRYTLDGEVKEDEWSQQIQRDGPGITLWALMRHLKRYNVSESLYHDLIEALAKEMIENGMKDGRNPWEDQTGVWPYVLGANYAGLQAVGREEEAKKFQDEIRRRVEQKDYLLDSSLIACVTHFGVMTPMEFQSVLEEIEAKLKGPGGGLYRYPEDTYYGGGQWYLLTAWLSQLYVSMGRLEEAIELVNWILARIDHMWQLGEQDVLNPRDRVMLEEWQSGKHNWGPPATRLLWSHTATIDAIWDILTALGEKPLVFSDDSLGPKG